MSRSLQAGLFAAKKHLLRPTQPRRLQPHHYNARFSTLSRKNCYWTKFYSDVDRCIAENFWGSLGIFIKSKEYGDPYIQQLEAMGYDFSIHGKPAPYEQSIQWVTSKLDKLVAEGDIAEQDVLRPGKAFSDSKDNHSTVCFKKIGEAVSPNLEPINLLTPDVFVNMLASGYFPIGEAIREHTNQTLAEHDLAHMAGFISNPNYMKAVRQGFNIVNNKCRHNPRIAKALTNFDSAYSLRLYYLIEVFTEVPEHKKQRLQQLIELPCNAMPNKDAITDFLLHKAQRPDELYRYLATLYSEFHSLVNALGGESRDVLNRRRKFHRGNTLGGFYDTVSTQTSKFAGNSIYAIFLNAKATLENVRSNHPEFLNSVTEVHAPAIGSLIGTSQLSVEDWVLEAMKHETPRKDSKLYQYIGESGFWGEDHLLYQAYCSPEFDKDLSQQADITDTSTPTL